VEQSSAEQPHLSDPNITSQEQGVNDLRNDIEKLVDKQTDLSSEDDSCISRWDPLNVGEEKVNEVLESILGQLDRVQNDIKNAKTTFAIQNGATNVSFGGENENRLTLE